MSDHYVRKKNLNFVGTSIMKEQKTSEGNRTIDVKSRLDELYDEIKNRDDVINDLKSYSNEWKEKYEILVGENCFLRNKINLPGVEELQKTIEKYQLDIKNYINDIQAYGSKICVYEERIKTQEQVISTRNDLYNSVLIANKSHLNRINELEKEIESNNYLIKSLRSDNKALNDLNSDLDKEIQSIKTLLNDKKLNQITQELDQLKITYSDLLDRHKSLQNFWVTGINSIIQEINSTSPKNQLEFLTKSTVDYNFSTITIEISKLSKENTSYLISNQSLLQKNSDMASKIQSYEETFNTLKEDLKKHSNTLQVSDSIQEELSSYKQKLQNQIESNNQKDKKILSLKNKIERLQQEIKSSFSKIDVLKSHLTLNEKNLVLIQQLQDLNKTESYQKKILRDQLDQYKKKIDELENENVKKNAKNPLESLQKGNKVPDSNFMLLKKIEYMRTELEQYCPSETSAGEELRNHKAAINKLKNLANSVEFALKCIEDDLRCRVCLKLDNLEIFTCGHLNCLICNNICKDCNQPAQSTDSSVFYRLNRRLNDIRRSLSTSKD